MTDTNRATTDFDRLARRLHAEAVAHVPWQTLARIRAASRGPVPRRPARRARALGWGVGLAAAGLLAIALGLRLGGPPTGADADADARRIVAHPGAGANGTDGYAGVFAALEEDPDFYLWLANTSVQPLALE